MRNFLLTSILLTTFALAFTGFRPAVDIDPSAILKSSKAKLQSLSDFGASFSYTLSGPGMNKPIERLGTLKYKKGMWAVAMGTDQLFCDLESVWIYQEEDESVTIMEYDPEEGMSVDALFELYETQADPRYEGEEVIDGKKCHKIYLAIKDASLDYNQAWIWIAKGDKLPKKAVLKTRSQSETTIAFTDMNPNRGFGQADFRFDESKYPGVEVYDER